MWATQLVLGDVLLLLGIVFSIEIVNCFFGFANGLLALQLGRVVSRLDPLFLLSFPGSATCGGHQSEGRVAECLVVRT